MVQFLSYFFLLFSLFSLSSCFWSSSSSDKNKKKLVKPDENRFEFPVLNITVYPNGETTSGVYISIVKSECNNLNDLSDYVCPLVNSINCTLFTPHGTRVNSCDDARTSDFIHFVPKDRLVISTQPQISRWKLKF